MPKKQQTKREERLTAILEGFAGTSGHHRNQSQAKAVPAPHLSSVSLKEFGSWRHKYEGHAVLTRMSSLSIAEQRSALISVLDDDWTRTLRYGLSLDDGADLKTILDAMELHLRNQRNVIVDRRNFHTRVQELHETFNDFLCGIKEIASFCDFCETCMDSRLRDRIVVGTRDEEALKRMLEEKKLTLQMAIDICRASKNANASRAVIRGSEKYNVSRVSQYKQGQKVAHLKQQCFRCGGERHRHKMACKALNKDCKQCGKKGHFAVVCRSKGQPLSPQKKKTNNKSTFKPSKRNLYRVIGDVYSNCASSCPTPQICISTTHPKGSNSVMWTPDSGAETTVIGLENAKSLGIHESSLEPIIMGGLIAADRQPLTNMGTFEAFLTLGNRSTTTVVSVVKEVKGALLSWFDCVALGILPENFPAQIQHLTWSVSQPHIASRTRKVLEPQVTSNTQDVVQSASTSSLVSVPMALPRWPHSRDPTETERAEHAASIISAYPHVFDASATLREIQGGPMRIQLSADAHPFAVTAPRTIPHCWRSDIKAQLDDLLAKDIIGEVDYPTEWCHPMVPIAKKMGGVRLCVDLTRLNRYVRRPTYPVRSPHDAISSMDAGARWFTTLDAKMGYFQIKIADEDQDLTCFITPWGRYKFKQAVMGLISSGDEYNRRGDQALGDIPRTVKIVDDILVYDSSYRDHLAHVITLVQKCDKFGMTLNPDKIFFAQPNVEFCGYSINHEGYSVDSRKVRAIAEFPKPQNITDLRSFMGLTNQLGSFSSAIATAAQPLRDLLKPQNEWCWTPQHDVAFEKTKEALIAPPVLAHFDASLPTMLQTDASRLHGMGFVLLQQHGEAWKLIQCRYRFLTDAETRYAVIEVEMAAVLWAVRKCSVYLSGLPYFDLVVDY
ncbi:uncharacterized protein LOC135222514 [Macrobrachium nipponense]|uniref:uncharacterized protein LOC135222514 n=1 Tax=Macrobrachium nipponense TaxID=159736 RepID=UPI0030C895AC